MSGGKKDPAFLLYATSWLQSDETNAMTLEQQGAYMRLLCFSWLHGTIPASHAEIRGLLGLHADEAGFARLWAGPLPRCWVPIPGTPGRLVNPRQEHERNERAARAEEMRRRGAAGGQQTAKQNRSREPAGGAAGPPADGQAEPQPSTSNGDREIASRGTGVPESDARARAAGSLVDGVTAARRARA
jgi:hypothetical protein